MKALRVRKLYGSSARCQGSLLESWPPRKPEEHIQGSLSVAGPFVGFFLQEVPLSEKVSFDAANDRKARCLDVWLDAGLSDPPWVLLWFPAFFSCLATVICCALCKMVEVEGEEEGGQGISWLLDMETQTPNFKTSRCWPSLPWKRTKSKSKLLECFLQKMGILEIVS